MFCGERWDRCVPGENAFGDGTAAMGWRFASLHAWPIPQMASTMHDVKKEVVAGMALNMHANGDWPAIVGVGCVGFPSRLFLCAAFRFLLTALLS